MTETNPKRSFPNQFAASEITSGELDFSYLISPIDLRRTIPDCLPSPKFRIGERVRWAKVDSHGYGRIIGLVFSSGISVQAFGFHYLVFFAAESPSRSDCIADWGFEDDLERLATHAHLLNNTHG